MAGAEGEYQLLLNSVEVGPLERESRKRLSSLYLLQGKFGAARDVLKETAEREVLQAASLRKQIMNLSNLMAHTYLVTGDIEKAHEVLDFLMENSALDPDPIFFRRLVLWGKGKIYRELLLIDELRGVADTLSQTENPFMSVMGRWYIHHINGLLSLEEGDTSEAIDQFKKVVALLPSQNINFGYNQHAIFLDSLAFAYFKAGDLERARTEYERITALTMGRLYFGDIYAESFYMLGKIYEQQGKKAKATQNYEKFLDFRKGADPGIAEVEDARQRLAGLR